MNNVIQFTPRPRSMYIALHEAWTIIVGSLGVMTPGVEHTIDPRISIHGLNFQQFRRAGAFGKPAVSPYVFDDLPPLPKQWTRWTGIPRRGYPLVPRYEFMTVLNELCHLTGQPELKEQVLSSKQWKRVLA